MARPAHVPGGAAERQYVPCMDAPPPPGRIELVAVDPPPQPRVRLRRGDAVATIDAEQGRDGLHALAAATTAAIGRLVSPVVRFAVDDVHLLTGSRPIVVVAVTITVAEVPLPHVGAAIVAGEVPEITVVKATLDAVNRRLAVLPY